MRTYMDRELTEKDVDKMAAVLTTLYSEHLTEPIICPLFEEVE